MSEERAVMTEEVSIQNGESTQNQTRGRRTLVMIALVSITPLALAYFMFFTGLGVPNNTVNSGTLLDSPLSLQELVSDDEWQRLNAEKKWRLLLPVGERCSEACAEHLYTTRQVHIRLSEKSIRIERVALNHGGEQGDAYLKSLAEEHPFLKTETVSADTWRRWLAQSPQLSAQAEDFYLMVDQEGLAMMMYTNEHGNDLLKDIKRALKYSIDFTD